MVNNIGLTLTQSRIYQPVKSGNQAGAASTKGMAQEPVLAVDGAGLKNAEGQQQSGRPNMDSFECETCKNRKYQDGSNDPGVSFKTPTNISPEQAATAVRAHEGEHVTRERASAAREGREIVSQSVTYHSGVCPECGRIYVAGGTTRTVSQKQVEQTYGIGQEEKGENFDQTA